MVVVLSEFAHDGVVCYCHVLTGRIAEAYAHETLRPAGTVYLGYNKYRWWLRLSY